MFFRYHLSKCFAVIFIFIGTISSLEAAEPGFKVSSYIPEKFADFEWILDGYFNVQGYSRDIAIKDTTGEDVDSYKPTNDEQTIAVATNLSYQYETVPWYLRWSARLAYSLQHVRSHSYSYSPFYNQPGIYPEIEAGKYLWGDFSIGGRIKAGWNYSHNLHDVNPDTRTLKYTFDGAASVGWGRVYNGRYAATALYIIDKLKNNRIAKRNADFGEMLALTEIIHTYRRKHSVDNRLHKIDALLNIMEYLEKQGIIEPTGPYGYLLIQDIWDYFPNESRLFGWQAKFYIGLEYNHYLSQTTDEYDRSDGTHYHSYYHDETEYQHPYFEATIEYHRPLGIKWQFDASTDWRYYFNYYSQATRYGQKYSPRAIFDFRKTRQDFEANYDFSLESTLIYIIDSRSSLHLRPSFLIRHYNTRINEIRESTDSLSSSWTSSNDHYDCAFEFATNFIYRISIPTTLNVEFLIDREFLEESIDQLGLHTYREKGFDYYLAASIRHYLF